MYNKLYAIIITKRFGNPIKIKKVRAEKRFKIIAPTDPKSLSGPTPKPFQLKIMGCWCDV